MEYQFVYALDYTVHRFSMYHTSKGVYGNGASAYICSCGVMEYCAGQNVTPVYASVGKPSVSVSVLHLFCQKSYN